VRLQWSPAQDDVAVAGYDVLREDEVVIRTAAGNLSRPAPPSCVRTAPAGTPAGPWDLLARHTPSGDLVLAWTPSDQPGVIYSVYWDGRGQEEKRIGSTALTSFTVFGPAARERHCFRVAAEDQAQRRSPLTLPVCVGPRASVSQAR
jgi:hypothetical protein